VGDCEILRPLIGGQNPIIFQVSAILLVVPSTFSQKSFGSSHQRGPDTKVQQELSNPREVDLSSN